METGGVMALQLIIKLGLDIYEAPKFNVFVDYLH